MLDVGYRSLVSFVRDCRRYGYSARKLLESGEYYIDRLPWDNTIWVIAYGF